jgi:hypothetical protein
MTLPKPEDWADSDPTRSFLDELATRAPLSPLHDLRSPTDSIRVASRIQESLVEPFVIAGQEVFTTASIGIAAS